MSQQIIPQVELQIGNQLIQNNIQDPIVVQVPIVLAGTLPLLNINKKFYQVNTTNTLHLQAMKIDGTIIKLEILPKTEFYIQIAGTKFGNTGKYCLSEIQNMHDIYTYQAPVRQKNHNGTLIRFDQKTKLKIHDICVNIVNELFVWVQNGTPVMLPAETRFEWNDDGMTMYANAVSNQQVILFHE